MRPRKKIVLPEVTSSMFPAISFTVIAPSLGFIRTEVLTVFPALKEKVLGDLAEANPNVVAAAAPLYGPAPASDIDIIQPMIITTFQESKGELISYNGAAAEFKDQSRDRFFLFAQEVERRLEGKGWFVDWVDPATGLPFRTHQTSSIFVEADLIEQLLSLEIVYVNGMGGGCRLINHPRWGTSVYPSSMVVYGGKSEELMELLKGL